MENLKKKRKMEDTGEESSSQTKEEIRSLVECLPQSQLVYLLCDLASQYPSVAEEIKTFATSYVVSYRTDSDALHNRFQAYGEIEKAVVICDKDIQSANTDGVGVACQLADEGQRVSLRKLYIGKLPPITNENLRLKFQMHGEIEDAVAHKNPNYACKNGYGFVTYKTAEDAKKAIDYYNTHKEMKLVVKYADSQSRPSFPPGFVQPENAHVSYGASYDYGYPQTAAVPYAPHPYQTAAAPPYAPPSYQTYGYASYPYVSAMIDPVWQQYYYDYPNPNQ